MNSFPLYNQIVNNLPTIDLTPAEREFFSDNIKNMDELGKELLFVLIYHFYSENKKKGKNTIIPYKGKKEEVNDNLTNFTWSLQDLPIPLRQILLKFMKMHIITMEEERSRNQLLHK